MPITVPAITQQVSDNFYRFISGVSDVNDIDLSYNLDFGQLKNRQTLFRQRVGHYIISKPVTIYTYWNEYGYTSVIVDFDSLYGYGENLQESIEDVLSHLEQDRSFYGQLQNGTESALELRDRLQSYLAPFVK